MVHKKKGLCSFERGKDGNLKVIVQKVPLVCHVWYKSNKLIGQIYNYFELSLFLNNTTSAEKSSYRFINKCITNISTTNWFR